MANIDCVDPATIRKIIRERKFGYRLWRIAQDSQLTVDEVADILVSNGVIHWKESELVKGRKIEREKRTNGH